MRELVIQEILNNFRHGLDEFGRAFYKGYPEKSTTMVQYEDWSNRYNNRISGMYKLLDFESELEVLLNKLSDKELLRALEGQHCQDYR